MKAKFIYVGLLLLGVTLLSISFGAVYIPIRHVFQELFLMYPTESHYIIVNYRLPRVLIGILAGIGLSASGALFQGVIKNPLVSPDVIGITKGAGVGAVIVLLVFPKNQWLLPLGAFIGAMIVSILLYYLTKSDDFSPKKVLLVGMALGIVCGAFINYMITKYSFDINSVLVWLTGSLWGSNYSKVFILAISIAVLLPLVLVNYRAINNLILGDEVAVSIGENLLRSRVILMVLGILLSSISVAYVGSLGFVGLIAPHIARKIVGWNSKYNILMSAFIGAILITLGDLAGRLMMPPVEIPVGIFAVVFGVPYLLYLLSDRGRKG